MFIYTYTLFNPKYYIYNKFFIPTSIRKEKAIEYISLITSNDELDDITFDMELIEIYNKGQYPVSPILLELKDYMNGKGIIIDNEIIIDLAVYMRETVSFDINQLLTALNITPKNTEKTHLSKIVEYLANSYNDTRLYKNRGVKPRELSERYQLKESELKGYLLKDVSLIKYHNDDFSYNENAYENSNGKSNESNVIKTGRNDPCPCGSGKKYKKCCL